MKNRKCMLFKYNVYRFIDIDSISQGTHLLILIREHTCLGRPNQDPLNPSHVCCLIPQRFVVCQDQCCLSVGNENIHLANYTKDIWTPVLVGRHLTSKGIFWKMSLPNSHWSHQNVTARFPHLDSHCHHPHRKKKHDTSWCRFQDFQTSL